MNGREKMDLVLGLKPFRHMSESELVVALDAMYHAFNDDQHGINRMTDDGSIELNRLIVDANLALIKVRNGRI